ncbi:MAG: hypothetical protein SRB1_02022 [Desulfobacteraceae bacterium Eth-SRB1]|nr:MAG: hypothetical protein SRB1_02022 [Desulfobacteraceae bacterium Eth-SRB1]
MKQVLIKQGQVILEDIPAPKVEAGKLLVQVQYSCISVGTEMSGVKASGIPLWKRALKQPEKVKKVVDIALSQGLRNTAGVVSRKVSTTQPTGYSAAGIVLEVGEGIADIQKGDKVACAGAQCAYHAEIINVPRNLVVPIPENLDVAYASTVTLGAIALQGVRRAQPTLGETFVVIGLGILGQLTVQILRVNGCRVIGTDIDRSRIQIAKEMGAHATIHPEDNNDIDQVIRLTDGLGADGVIITAATPSDSVISTAFQMCRKKGRVVLVGDVGLNLNRADFYQKELDLFISTSYGPGRYDRAYEEEGLDYPVGYVRWTENRNMAEYLRLINENKIELSPLISQTYPIDQVSDAYISLGKDVPTPLIVLLSYPEFNGNTDLNYTVKNPKAKPAGTNQIKIAVIGAGNFAQSTHLPNISSLPKYFHLYAIMNRHGHTAKQIAEQFNADYATTDYHRILSDPEVEAVIISTRHDLHSLLTLEALEAGKHVLVEKPLALTSEELEKIKAFYSQTSKDFPILLTGFNRRFSPIMSRIHELLEDRSNPIIMNYRMNAGYIPLDHWVHGKEGGGRNIGEACHIYDLFTYLTNAHPAKIEAQCLAPQTNYYSRTDNFVATISFDDGSVATLTYTALGTNKYPKELLEIYTDGNVFLLEDYRKLSIFGSKSKNINNKKVEKGHKEELIAFARAIQQGGEWSNPLWQQIQATEISFEVEKRMREFP